MQPKEISIDKAKKDKLFYFVANVVIYRAEDARCLILKRDEREIAHPGRWAVPGGKYEWKDMPVDKPTRINGDVLDFEDAVEDLLVRESKEEANVDVDTKLHYINSVAFIRPDNVPVMLVKFAARYLGGDVVPEKGGFTDFAWVNAEEIKKYECIDGIPEEVEKTINHFKEHVS
ncbi:NUDIX domain-containing protein [candidate division KSB1 bacterium]